MTVDPIIFDRDELINNVIPDTSLIPIKLKTIIPKGKIPFKIDL